jgi:hypothetical protein
MELVPATPDAIVSLKPDRRAGVRFVHHERVRLDGRPARARNISARGLAVIMTRAAGQAASRLRPGDVVEVMRRVDATGAGLGSARARVARIEASPRGVVAGLEFLQS